MPIQDNPTSVVGTQTSDQLNGTNLSDMVVGLAGDDTISSAAGDDIIYGDFVDTNLLSGTDGATSFSQYANTGAWDVTTDAEGRQSMTQSITTLADQEYKIEFDLAANYASGTISGAVEVVWNGYVIGTVDTNSAEFSKKVLSFTGTGTTGDLTFRAVESTPNDGPEINTDGPVFFYDQDMEIGEQTVTVKAFAEAQPHIYQVINGTLHVFDPEAQTYTKAGADATVTVNAIGFNTEDNLIYGIAVSNGSDSLGNAVSKSDLVMLDASGDSYRIGSTPYRSWTADFDADGNLWAFHSSMDRITVIDVDNVGADGVVSSQTFKFPKSMITDQLWDVAFDKETNTFYGVTRPSSEGQNSLLYEIDISAVASGGEPVFQTTEIAGTLVDGTMKDGVPAITFGAAIHDADGNLYVGGNSGDHDMNDVTRSAGGIYKVVTNEQTGEACLELISDSPRSSSNDGTADPRAMDPFTEIDRTAAVLIRQPEVVATEEGSNSFDDVIEASQGADFVSSGLGDDTVAGQSGNDELIGGIGDDRLFGGNVDPALPPRIEYYDDQGNRFDADGNLLAPDDDVLSGGIGMDYLHGGAGHDKLDGGVEDDELVGGSGFDELIGGAGNDYLAGGSEKDVLHGGDGDDHLVGSYGEDNLFGGDGQDTLQGGSEDDMLYGGLGDDLLQGGTGDDILVGGAGNDVLQGSTGNDHLSSAFGDNLMNGGSGDDVLVGGIGVDNLVGGSGTDTLLGEDGQDVLKGGTGNDVLKGGADKDKIYGGSGDDEIDGGTGSDYINASSGDDTIDGGDGKDKIIMGAGADTAYGGAESDWFVFNFNDDDGEFNIICDYTNNGLERDRIDLRAFGLIEDEQGQDDWIMQCVSQKDDNSVQIEFSNFALNLLDHNDLGFEFFEQVTWGLELI